ncbi:uncharacterized protein [Ptychodera flava]|uniref:uncharacterized protein n=1 Tax=Ptychodera flava TaxID=63121 RepID=UPI003969DA6C
MAFFENANEEMAEIDWTEEEVVRHSQSIHKSTTEWTEEEIVLIEERTEDKISSMELKATIEWTKERFALIEDTAGEENEEKILFEQEYQIHVESQHLQASSMDSAEDIPPGYWLSTRHVMSYMQDRI